MEKIDKSIQRTTSLKKHNKTRQFYNDRFHLKGAANLLTSEPETSSTDRKNVSLKLPHLSARVRQKSFDAREHSNPEYESSPKAMADKLSMLWAQKNVPIEIQDTITLCFNQLPRQKAANSITHEIKSLIDGSSPTLLVLKSIKNREESLQSIHDLNSYLVSSNWLPLQQVHLQCAELLHGHRLFTLSVIENIVKWREMLTSSLIINNSSVKFVEFKVEKVNYVLKMRSDLNFLRNSEFAKILSFSEEEDPLLVSPSVPLGKTERGRKRDPNYFIDGGCVVVPIPSFLASRVKVAEEQIRREYEYIKFLEENTPEKQAEMFAPSVLEGLIEELVGEAVAGIAKGVEKDQKKLFREMREKKEKEKLIREIGEDLEGRVIGEMVRQIAEDEFKNAKLTIKQYQENRVAELILEQMLAQMIGDKALEEIAKEQRIEIKAEAEAEQRRIKELEGERNLKLSKEIQASLFETFLNASMKEIALEGLKEIRKERDEENSIYAIKSAFMDEIGLDFALMENFSDLSEMRWVPLGLPEELIIDILNEYYTMTPDINHTILPDIECLLLESYKYADCCWYWALKGTLILGFLVFSVDCFNKTGRKLIVHHISSLFWNKFSEILESATQHLWKIDKCDEIRVNLFTRVNHDLEPEIKRIFTQQGYKWKTKYQLKDSRNEITVLGKSRGEKKSQEAHITFRLQCSNFMTTSNSVEANHEISKNMLQIGNRQNLLHCLLGLFGHMENSKLKLSSTSKTKLQEVVTSLLNLMNETQCFSFPYMASSTTKENFTSFLANYNIKAPVLTEIASASVLDLKFRWISVTNFVQNIRGRDYRYMRFKSTELKQTKVNSDIEIYYLPTELPNISAFFVKSREISADIHNEVKEKKLDMFSYTEKLLQREGQEELSEVWVPCFNIKADWEVHWMEGYDIPAQIEGGSSLFVQKCFEEVKATMNLNPVAEGLLISNNKYGPVLMNDFIFGLLYSKGDKILDIPLFTCLVKETDWIQA